jgi:hypothetical protein
MGKNQGKKNILDPQQCPENCQIPIINPEKDFSDADL